MVVQRVQPPIQNELSRGEHAGYHWYTSHNSMGYRLGYINVPMSHPFAGKPSCHKDLYGIEVHGGITWSDAGPPCDEIRPNNQWWLGFDCGHWFDLPDMSLLDDTQQMLMDEARAFNESLLGIVNSLPRKNKRHFAIRTQDYVENECRQLCEQARAAEVLR